MCALADQLSTQPSTEHAFQQQQTSGACLTLLHEHAGGTDHKNPVRVETVRDDTTAFSTIATRRRTEGAPASFSQESFARHPEFLGSGPATPRSFTCQNMRCSGMASSPPQCPKYQESRWSLAMGSLVDLIESTPHSRKSHASTGSAAIGSTSPRNSSLPVQNSKVLPLRTALSSQPVLQEQAKPKPATVLTLKSNILC